MGQAAGTAVALAVESGAKDIRQISVPKLRSILTADAMELDPGKHTAFAPHNTRLVEKDEVGIN
jgi:hypothetical protein